MDLLRSMESFARVVRAGSFAGAANGLGVSRAIVSKHVQDLEDNMGARLLYRTTRRLSLTEIGVRHYAFCTRILDEIEEEREQVVKLHREPRGEIRMMAPKSFGNQYLAGAIADFVATHAGIKVALVLGDDAPISASLIDNGVDLAIRLTPAVSSTMMVQRIGTLRWLLCAAPSYLNARGTPRRPADLTQHEFLLHSKYLDNGVLTFKTEPRKSAVKVVGRFSANSSLAVRSAARRGLGVAALPMYCVADDLADGGLMEILPEYALAPQPVFALYPQQRLLPTKVRVLLNFLKVRFQGPL